MNERLNVAIWDEYPAHAPKEIYPEGIRGAVADGLSALDLDGLLNVTTVGLEDPDQGVPEDFLAGIDVLLWWGHARHGEVAGATADRVNPSREGSRNGVHLPPLGSLL